MSSNPNSRSDFVVEVKYTPTAPGDCLNDKTMSELTRRLQASVSPTSSVGSTVVSSVPPDDKTVIWYISDSNGVPTGESYRWVEFTQSWEGAGPVIPDATCISGDSGNLIKEDNTGCWKVETEDVDALVQAKTLGISTNLNNKLVFGSDDGLYVPQDSIPEISTDAQNQLGLGGDYGWFVPDPDVWTISTDTSNNIIVGADGGLYAPDSLAGSIPDISTDTDNGLSVGSDGGWFVPESGIVEMGRAMGEIYGSNRTITVGAGDIATDLVVDFNQAGTSNEIPPSLGDNGFVIPTAGIYAITLTASTAGGSGDAHSYVIGINGAGQEKTRVFTTLQGAGEFQTVATQCFLDLAEGDLIQALAQTDAAIDINYHGVMQLVLNELNT